MKKSHIRIATIAGLGVVVLLAGFLLLRPRGMISPVKILEVRVLHRQHQDFQETYELQPWKQVFIHDTDYRIVLEDFVSDFALDTSTKEVITRSDNLVNPAAKISLWFGDRLVYKSWIFGVGVPPHQVRDPGFIFAIDRVEQE